jgi:hypothetical protein
MPRQSALGISGLQAEDEPIGNNGLRENNCTDILISFFEELYLL